MLLTVLFVYTACKADAEIEIQFKTPEATITGVVKNATVKPATAISGATISLYSIAANGTRGTAILDTAGVAITATSGTDGSFSLLKVQSGEYFLVATKTDFVEFSQATVVKVAIDAETITLGYEVLMVPAKDAAGKNYGVRIVASWTSNADLDTYFSFPRCDFNAYKGDWSSPYYPDAFSGKSHTKIDVLSEAGRVCDPNGTNGQFVEGTRGLIWYKADGNADANNDVYTYGGDPMVKLDVDNRQGSAGPETLTIYGIPTDNKSTIADKYEVGIGLYTIREFNNDAAAYSGRGADTPGSDAEKATSSIAKSAATINVFDGTKLLATYKVPELAAENTTNTLPYVNWRVFEVRFYVKDNGNSEYMDIIPFGMDNIDKFRSNDLLGDGIVTVELPGKKK